jgi:hypothetical protein
MFIPLTPPPQYDHPYAGPVQEAIVSEWTAQDICKPYGAQPYACSFKMADGTCLIVMVKGLPADIAAKFRRHEEAHCTGWPADHPGGTR